MVVLRSFKQQACKDIHRKYDNMGKLIIKCDFFFLQVYCLLRELGTHDLSISKVQDTALEGLYVSQTGLIWKYTMKSDKWKLGFKTHCNRKNMQTTEES